MKSKILDDKPLSLRRMRRRDLSTSGQSSARMASVFNGTFTIQIILFADWRDGIFPDLWLAGSKIWSSRLLEPNVPRCYTMGELHISRLIILRIFLSMMSAISSSSFKLSRQEKIWRITGEERIMRFSAEAIVGIVGLLVTLPPSIFIIWKAMQRRNRNNNPNFSKSRSFICNRLVQLILLFSYPLAPLQPVLDRQLSFPIGTDDIPGSNLEAGQQPPSIIPRECDFT